jgi:hypothetical protein
MSNHPDIGCSDHMSVTSKPSGITNVWIEQKFIDWFPGQLSRPDIDLTANFSNGVEIAVEKFVVHISTDINHDIIVCPERRMPISNIKDIDIDSGMMLIHLKVGKTIEVDLV